MTTLHDLDRQEERRRQREELRSARTSVPAFRIVDELPVARTGRRIPEQRQQLIEFAKQNPGRWIEYRSTDADPFAKSYSFANTVRKGVAGFGPKGAFEARSTGDLVYLRYVGGAQ